MTGAPLIWLTKRRYMGKDLIGDRFGRYFELPLALSESCANHVFCIDYKRTAQADHTFSDSLSISSYPATQLFGLSKRLVHALTMTSGTLIAAGDAPFIAFGAALAKRASAPFVADLYDDFGTFASRRIPFMRRLFLNALAAADRVVAFEDAYARRLSADPAVPDFHRPVVIAPNGVDAALFHPMDRGAARRRIGVEMSDFVVGYFGGMDAGRTIDELFEAFSVVKRRRPGAELWLAGDHRGAPTPPDGARYFGRLPQSALPALINACDVAAATVRKDASAAISFPQKLMEYAACRTPFVTPAIGGAAQFLEPYPDYTYPLGDVGAFADKLLAFADRSRIADIPVRDWRTAAKAFATALDDHPTRQDMTSDRSTLQTSDTDARAGGRAA